MCIRDRTYGAAIEAAKDLFGIAVADAVETMEMVRIPMSQCLEIPACIKRNRLQDMTSPPYGKVDMTRYTVTV